MKRTVRFEAPAKIVIAEGAIPLLPAIMAAWAGWWRSVDLVAHAEVRGAVEVDRRQKGKAARRLARGGRAYRALDRH